MSSEMNLTNKLQSPDVLSRIASVDWSGKSELGPYVVELDPTAACDMACPGCISEDIINEGGRFQNNRFMALPVEFQEAGVKAVILIGGGEPLTHPKVGNFISECELRDIKIGLTTNGTLIHKYLDVIAEKCSWTRVSMDAGTQKMFDSLRPTKKGVSAFSQVVSNMEALARIKQGLLGYSFLLQSPADGQHVTSNLDDLYSAAKLAKEIGCDYFEVKPSYAWRGNIPHALMIHSSEYLSHAKEIIEKLNSLETDDFKIIHAINLKYSLDGVQLEQPKNYKDCPSAQLRTLVTPKGVYVCPYWRGKDQFKLGDLNVMSLKELWSSSKKVQVMERLNPMTDCSFHCLRHETNAEAIRIKESLNPGMLNDTNTDEEWDRFI